MQAIIVIVSLIGWKVSGIEFTTLFFYIELSFSIWEAVKNYTNDKTAKRQIRHFKTKRIPAIRNLLKILTS